MNSKYVIDSACRLTTATARWTISYRPLGVSMVIVFLFAATISQLVSASRESVSPQGANPEQVAATIKANAQALKAFSYQQRMQLQLKGETKKVTLNQMSYDINGNLQKTLLSEQPPAGAQPSGGRIKRRVVARKTSEFKEMMDELAALVKSYSELPPERLQTSLKQAASSAGQGDMAGSVQIVMQNVIQNGDSITIWIDRTTMLFRRILIATSYDGNPVTAMATYATLTNGEGYMAQAVLNYAKKEVVVQIDNSNYQRNQ